MKNEEELIKANIFPKEFVEGIIAECIAQIKFSLDVLREPNLVGVKRVDSIKDTFLIAMNESQSVIKMLEHYNDASLSPKHKLARYVLKSLVKRLTDIHGFMDAKRANNSRVVEFARVITGFLVAIHTIMHADTSPKVREMRAAEFCGDDLDEYGATIAKVITIH